MTASVRWAKVLVRANLNELDHLDLIAVSSRSPEIAPGLYDFEMIAPILHYDRSHLDQSGYIVVNFLNALEAQEKKVYGVYGPFVDHGQERCHLIAPAIEASARDFRVYSWRVLEWQSTMTI